MQHHYDDLDENYSMWDGAWECHCTSDTKPWCTCDKETCQQCIEEAADNYENDFTDPWTPWKYSNHLQFGVYTDRLFETLLLGLQRLTESGQFEPADRMMLEEMLENWTFQDCY